MPYTIVLYTYGKSIQYTRRRQQPRCIQDPLPPIDITLHHGSTPLNAHFVFDPEDPRIPPLDLWHHFHHRFMNRAKSLPERSQEVVGIKFQLQNTPSVCYTRVLEKNGRKKRSQEASRHKIKITAAIYSECMIYIRVCVIVLDTVSKVSIIYRDVEVLIYGIECAAPFIAVHRLASLSFLHVFIYTERKLTLRWTYHYWYQVSNIEVVSIVFVCRYYRTWLPFDIRSISNTINSARVFSLWCWVERTV